MQSCSPHHWQRATRDEGWPVPAAALHVAFGHLVITTWLHRLAAGLPVLETLDDFTVMNAHDAGKNAARSPDAVVDALRLYGAAAERFVGELTDDELDRPARLPGLGVECPLRAVVENVLLAHPRGHLASMRAGLGQQ